MSKKAVLDLYTQTFIHAEYPEIKQKSDDIDWKVHTSRLVYYSGGQLSVDKIGQLVYESSAKVLTGQSTFEDEMKYLTTIFNLPESWEQLLKVGIRNGWVDVIKQYYKQLLQDPNVTETNAYFYVRKVYPKLSHFLPNKESE